jgi:hypothetical protein
MDLHETRVVATRVPARAARASRTRVERNTALHARHRVRFDAAFAFTGWGKRIFTSSRGSGQGAWPAVRGRIAGVPRLIRRLANLPLALEARAALDASAAPPMPHRAASRRVPTRIRIAVLIALLSIAWVLLLGWAAEVPLSAPLVPAERMRQNGADFDVVMGAGVDNEKRLAINAVGAEHIALQSRKFASPIDAAAFPLLRYRWDDFPRTLELSFVFRRADEPNDVHTVTLPPAAAHPGYFDLSTVPEWSGRIVEIGFSEFPTAQLVPADIAFRPFVLVDAELWSPSWRGSLGALGTDWAAYRPWALMSVSALGPDAPWPHKATPVLVLSIGLVASVVAATIVLAQNLAWLGTMIAIAIAGGWIALDLRWIGELADRHALTRELYAGKPWRERAAIEPDTALVAAASRVRDVIAREPPGAHVIVSSPAVYDLLRLDYHLLPANVAPVAVLVDAPSKHAMRPALLVTYADDEWRYDAARGIVRWMHGAYAADAVLDEGDLRVFRLRERLP